jgi:hypothetical protein
VPYGITLPKNGGAEKFKAPKPKGIYLGSISLKCKELLL